MELYTKYIYLEKNYQTFLLFCLSLFLIISQVIFILSDLRECLQISCSFHEIKIHLIQMIYIYIYI